MKLHQAAVHEPATQPEKKIRSTRSALISGCKWYATIDRKYVYSFMPRTMPNRSLKDEMVATLKKRNIDPTILSKRISNKATGESVDNYVIAIPHAEFLAAFPAISFKVTPFSFS